MEQEATTIRIEGMTCGHCQHSVHQALMAVPGVTEVTVDLESGEAQVRGADVTPAAAVAAVLKIGFGASV